MFTKVLIAEDMDDINKGVYATLCELGIPQIDQVQYCDDAFLKLKRGEFDHTPYELLITDLSFATDHRHQRFSSGEVLVASVKQEFPQLKVIVYSVEDRLQKVRMLVTDHHIDAYVCKSRKGLKELNKAIAIVYKNGTYLSPEVANALSPNNDLEIDEYDLELIRQLSQGKSQDEISNLFKAEDISPSSLSSIEKRLNKLRIQFNAHNAIHLVAIVKDLGLI
tara:strand:- start:447 stop:1112 length:666 start_codon:yes stop_codon:yes gene_type:complete